jgi:rhodanese-related sulfurtransferase
MNRRRLTYRSGTAAAFFLALVFTPGCVDWPLNPAVQDVTPEAAAALIASHAGDTDFVIMDVRNPDEFATGHLQSAVNVCYLCPDFAAAIAALDKSKTYLVYCGTEHRSPLATAAMIDAGFTRVYNLTGGIVSWQSGGYPVVD